MISKASILVKHLLRKTTKKDIFVQFVVSFYFIVI